MNTPQAGAGRLPLLSLRYAIRSSRVKILVIVMGGVNLYKRCSYSREEARGSGRGESWRDIGEDERLFLTVEAGKSYRLFLGSWLVEEDFSRYLPQVSMRLAADTSEHSPPMRLLSMQQRNQISALV